MLEKFFKLKENHTDVKTEVLAGITTFMTMAYILAVNPTMLADAGMDKTAVLIATCLAAFVGTLAMALFANYPFALAPGMGLHILYVTLWDIPGKWHLWQCLSRELSLLYFHLQMCVKLSSMRFLRHSKKVSVQELVCLSHLSDYRVHIL